jgi:hypothetical protein
MAFISTLCAVQWAGWGHNRSKAGRGLPVWVVKITADTEQAKKKNFRSHDYSQQHFTIVHATIIPFRTDPLSSELGSQPELGCISTGERDHLGTRSVVVF